LLAAANKQVFQIQYTFMTNGTTNAQKAANFRSTICPQNDQYNMHSILRDQLLKSGNYWDCR
jgi:hypothetical protein